MYRSMNRTTYRAITKAILLSTVFLLSSLSFAEDANTTKTIAMIISHLNHFPSAEEKETLAKISMDEGNSEATRTIAKALAGVQHKAGAQDVAALQAVVDQSDSTEAEKKLAQVIMGINHKPSAEGLAVLKSL